MQEIDVSKKVWRWRLAMWVTASALLITPAIAMQITPELRWGPGDFVIFAGMLAALCCAVDALVRVTQRPAHRIAGAFVILAVFLLVWAELAVGIW